MFAAPKRLPSAVADLVSAAEWYDDQQAGLGHEFVQEADAVILSLAQNALIHSIRFADVRCARLKRFKPYGIYFYLWQNEIIVFAVFHASRHPSWLRQRRHELD